MPRLRRAFDQVAEELMAEGLLERQMIDGQPHYRLSDRGLEECEQMLREKPEARTYLAHTGRPV